MRPVAFDRTAKTDLKQGFETALPHNSKFEARDVKNAVGASRALQDSIVLIGHPPDALNRDSRHHESRDRFSRGSFHRDSSLMVR